MDGERRHWRVAYRDRGFRRTARRQRQRGESGARRACRRSVALVLLLASAACTAAHPQATSRPAASPPGWRLVSYRGVELDVPKSWPVVDGNHTGFCDGPFPDKPTAFVGANFNGAPSCGAPGGGYRPPARDGVWLAPGEPSTGGAEIHPVPGLAVYQVVPGPPVRILEYHDVQVEIGIGPNPALARRILATLHYRPGVPDSARSLVCRVSSGPLRMPTPTRLSSTMVLNQGNITLNPPEPADQAATSATAAWSHFEPGIQFLERYQLLLARYSAGLPAKLEPNGSLVPEEQGVLAWVIYESPLSPSIPDCGGWGINAYAASSGQSIAGSGWSPGP